MNLIRLIGNSENDEGDNNNDDGKQPEQQTDFDQCLAKYLIYIFRDHFLWLPFQCQNRMNVKQII